VTPENVRELRRTGLALDEDQLIAFKVHEVTPEYVAKVKALDLGNPDADQLIALAGSRRDAGVHRQDEVTRPEESDARSDRGTEKSTTSTESGSRAGRGRLSQAPGFNSLVTEFFGQRLGQRDALLLLSRNPRSARASTEMLAEGGGCFGMCFHVNLSSL
jgi:hypothetical protein